MKLYFPSLAVFFFACSSDKGVTVFNPNPEAQISSHSDGDEVLEGYVITFTGNVDDANHSAEDLTTIWKSGSDILCEATVANSDGTSVCEAVLTPDDTEITLEVKDAENAPGSDTISITVIPSENPIAEIVTPEANGIYYSDQLITFEGLLSDEEDDAELLVALWESNRDGALTDVDAEPDSSGSILGYGYLTEGEHAIELTVEDTTGKTDRTSVIIDVGPPNSAPLCDILSPEDGSAGLEGESVDFTASVSDVDVSASLLSVTWSSDKDGDIGSSTPDSAGNVSFPFADLSVNTHVISMIVTDEVGAECVANLNYTVGTPPSITIDAPVDGDTINEGTNITFSATVADLQDQPDEVLLDWSLDGTSFSTQGATSSGTAEFSDSSLSYGTYNLVVTATDTNGFTDSDQINFTVNGLPTQPVLSITPDPASTNDTLTVNLDTSSTDPEGSTINYTYEWLLGGAVQSSYTSSTLPSSATSKNEQWTVRVTPNDGTTDGPAGEATVTIGNTAPTLSSLAITPTTNIYNDITLTCSVVVTDPDETLTPNYEWSIGSNVVGSGSTLDLSAAGAMPDDVITCAASVTDGDGESASDSTTTSVANRAPLVSGIAISPNTGISTSETLTCSATLSDADGETVAPTYEWSVGTSVLGTGDTLTLSPNSISPNDVITCTISTEDAYGGNASDSTTVTIDSTAPTIDSVVISPDSGVGRNTTLTCAGSASDVDGDALTESYEWTNTTQGTTLGTSDTLSLNSSLANLSDDITCTYTVVDSWGETTSQSSSVMVESTAPTVDSVTVTPSSGAVGDVLTCVATASDLDGGQPTLSYSWSSSAGVIGVQDTLTLSASNSDVGETITCTATATDAQSLSDSGTATATVDNSVPTWNYVSIYTNPLYNYSEANCYAQVTDPDGPLSSSAYTFSWENTTTGTFLGTGASITLTSNDAMPGDIITCTGTADDGFVTITDTHSKTVGNSTPYVATVTISPSTPSNSDLVTCSATVNDADNETNISYTYRWRNDTQGVNLGMGSTLQLDSSMISSGEELRCHVTSEDAGGLTDTDYTTVTLSNTAPVIDSISISPSSPTEDTSSLTCNVSTSDADGDTVSLSYEWLVDTQPQTETSNMFAGPFVFGSIIACRVTPNDGKIDGSVGEDTATVANTPPVVDSVTLSPSTVYTNDTITATATVSDADSGQTLSVFYEWHVIDSDTGLDSTPSSGYGIDTYTGFSRDDEVYVIVTVNDNIDNSDPLTSSSITISNTAPTAPNVSIAPDPAIAGQDDLVCSVDTPSSDDDGDSVVYTYVWTDDSGTVQQTTTESSATSDTFLASDTSEGTWNCEVTPYDMIDYGSSGSATTTIDRGCYSLEFNYGSSSYVQLHTGSSIDLSNSDFTIESWIYPTQDLEDEVATIIGDFNGLSNSSNGTGAGWNFWMDKTSGGFGFTQNTGGILSTNNFGIISTTLPPMNEWSHVAVSRSGNQFYLFLNGTLLATESSSITFGSSSGDLFVGRPSSTSPTSWTWDGYIAEIHISSNARYTSSFTVSSYVVSTETLGSWDFAGSGLTVEDDSSNSNDGTINGATWINICPEEADLDGDGYTALEDCDDTRSHLHPYDSNSDGTNDACGWKDFDLGERLTCAIDSDDELHCWGAGEIDNNCDPTQAPPQYCGQALPPSGTFSQVSAGYFSPCALDLQGEVQCWGSDYQSVLSGVPSGNFQEIFVSYGGGTACVKDSSDSLQCWGNNHVNQANPPSGTFGVWDMSSVNGCAINGSGSLQCWGHTVTNINSAPGGSFIDVGVGGQVACGLKSNNEITCWGTPEPQHQNILTDIPSGTFEKLECNGPWGCCALDSIGELACWGGNSFGLLDYPSGSFDKVELGDRHACARDLNGNLTCWGSDSSGQATVP